MGPTAAYARRVGESLVTVVGEVPPSTVRAVAASVEFRGTR
jgi:negative regulator of sigma E activity